MGSGEVAAGAIGEGPGSAQNFGATRSYDRWRPMPLLEELKAKACALLGRAMSSSSRTEGDFAIR